MTSTAKQDKRFPLTSAFTAVIQEEEEGLQRDANDVGLQTCSGKLADALEQTEIDDFTHTNELDLCERSARSSTTQTAIQEHKRGFATMNQSR